MIDACTTEFNFNLSSLKDLRQHNYINNKYTWFCRFTETELIFISYTNNTNYVSGDSLKYCLHKKQRICQTVFFASFLS